MKTINDINTEISELQDRNPAKFKDTKEYKKAEKQAQLLRTCATYLQLNPTRDAMVKDLELVEKKIKAAEDGYSVWLTHTTFEEKGKNPKQTYRAYMGIRNLELQRRSLQFLLS